MGGTGGAWVGRGVPLWAPVDAHFFVLTGLGRLAVFRGQASLTQLAMFHKPNPVLLHSKQGVHDDLWLDCLTGGMAMVWLRSCLLCGMLP